MRILAINGSPTSKDTSTTALVMKQFLDGCQSAGAITEIVHLSEKRIRFCDCGHEFTCWVKTPGKCVYHTEDDVAGILEQMSSADAIVFGTPVYTESMSGLMKTFLDRTLPLLHPHIESHNGFSRHPLRSLKEGIRFVLVSVCGHHEVSNFEALVHTFERLSRNLHGQLVGKILRPHAMMLKRDDLNVTLRQRVMDAIGHSGRKFIENGFIDKSTEQEMQMNLIPRSAFIDQTNRAWNCAIEKGERD